MRVRNAALPSVLLALLALTGCGQPIAGPASDSPASPATSALPDFRKAERYPYDAASPLADRVGPIPEALLAHLREYDHNPAYTGYVPNGKERRAIAKSIGQLPPSYQKQLAADLVGIYFIENFQGSGWCDWLVRPDGTFACYMAINPMALAMNVSEMLTWKEYTAVKPRPDGAPVVIIDCGDSVSALTFILLHEATHGVDYSRRLTPYVDRDLFTVSGFVPGPDALVTPYWAGYDILRPEFAWPYQGRISFYGLWNTPQFSAAEVHTALRKTPCVSLYATLNWAEDLAELVAFDTLVNRLGCPYRIVVNNQAGEFIEEPMRRPAVMERLPALRARLESL